MSWGYLDGDVFEHVQVFPSMSLRNEMSNVQIILLRIF